MTGLFQLSQWHSDHNATVVDHNDHNVIVVHSYKSRDYQMVDYEA